MSINRMYINSMIVCSGLMIALSLITLGKVMHSTCSQARMYWVIYTLIGFCLSTWTLNGVNMMLITMDPKGIWLGL
jgi:hypothetical protein